MVVAAGAAVEAAAASAGTAAAGAAAVDAADAAAETVPCSDTEAETDDAGEEGGAVAAGLPQEESAAANPTPAAHPPKTGRRLTARRPDSSMRYRII